MEGTVTGKSAGELQHKIADAINSFVDNHEFLDGMKIAEAIIDACPFLISSSVKDVQFLAELRDRLIKSRSDVTQYEYALQMVDDWLHELKSGEAGKLPEQQEINAGFLEGLKKEPFNVIRNMILKYLDSEQQTALLRWLTPEHQPADAARIHELSLMVRTLSRILVKKPCSPVEQKMVEEADEYLKKHFNPADVLRAQSEVPGEQKGGAHV